MELQRILYEKEISDGVIYSDRDGSQRPLTDAMIDRIFFDMNTDDLRYVRSMALFVTRRFSDREILVLELYDPSHSRTVESLLLRRAEKKENAVLSRNGVYLYLMCGID